MWKQFMDKWKRLFESEEQEQPFDENRIEENRNQERTTSTYRSTEAKSKITYHYPKTGSFRFPMIPDETEGREPKRQRSESRQTKETGERKEHRERFRNDDQQKRKSGEKQERRDKERPVPSEEPFKPTSVPSPVHGFRQQTLPREDNNAVEKNLEEVLSLKREQPSIPQLDTPFSMEEEEVDSSSVSSWSEENEEIAQVETDETEIEIQDSGPMREEYREDHPEEFQEAEDETLDSDVPSTIITREPLEEVEEETEVPVQAVADPAVQAQEEIDEIPSEERSVSEHETGSDGSETEEMPERESVQREPETNIQQTSQDSAEDRKEKKPSVPFNVIMTPRDKHARNKSRSEEKREKNKTAEETSVESPVEKKEEAGRVEYELPLHLFNDKIVQAEDEDHLLREQMNQLESTLQQFQVKAKVTDAMKGPAVTRFEVQPEPGVKVSKITNLSDDIKLGMAARDIRMEAPIPGKQAVGIEVPNQKAQVVGLQEIFETEDFRSEQSPLTIGLGLDIAGVPSVTNLKDMPHGLIAGATGSGKSVCINTILLSLIYKSHYEDVKFLLIDPKMVELAPYNDLPHLVSPVITDVKAATTALKWAVQEMEERYEKFVEYGVRDVERFNEKVTKEGKEEEKLPYLVIVIDELADLMMTSPQDVEDAICKIAQKARACGIHLLVATQRPSVDVITGLIKANIPTRIAFSVSSQADSRTVLDSGGAEKLLGKGDMLFMGNGDRTPKRIQGAFVSDDEIMRVTNHMKKIAPSNYLFEQDELLKQVSAEEDTDELFDEAVAFVVQQNGASASLIQRRFRVGYNRAARLVDQMEQHGIISEQKGSKPRDILWTREQLEEWKQGETS
ncbi:DNA translocase FtsK [Salimicrobium halophilum]|nr:DNA translocase FtsK [Salimicrobium halophilum]